MFRQIYSDTEHKCQQCKQNVVLVVSPQYLSYDIEIEEGLFDDILNTKFAVIKQKRIKLSDTVVEDWMPTNQDQEFMAQLTNGSALLMILNRRNAVEAGSELAKFHNRICKNKLGKTGVYVSPDIIEAQRDIRLLFPEVKQLQDDLAAVRSYAATHIATPLTNELASLRIMSSQAELSQAAIKERFGKHHF
ncbi:unnamed protein product [Bursaphelenchus okinawaensis]|uniref:Uncharacterized protein n=1 Tax=Bursaphelenchus okinawaensis TaxID=465554 RepID=A0A811KT35_9BILA|nr:unnamed protein product [Bursaphelenchus okinawaensis]CAG9109526.1 unnamed protein product [Bursaphelenchus okinawaensis]